jgi:hypothetical protein
MYYDSRLTKNKSLFLVDTSKVTTHRLISNKHDTTRGTRNPCDAQVY